MTCPEAMAYTAMPGPPTAPCCAAPTTQGCPQVLARTLTAAGAQHGCMEGPTKHAQDTLGLPTRAQCVRTQGQHGGAFCATMLLV